MIKKVIETVDKYNMINKGDKVIVALSGGADSMSLLKVLSEIKKDYNLELYAAHINHMIRGKEADDDEAFCKEFCNSIGVQFFSKSVDVEKLAVDQGVSTEMAGREVRYNFFMELFNKLNANKIAIAHNENDQAETVLMRIMRGSGIEGLTGISPVRDGIFIRPLIRVSRKEIELYCEEKNLPYRIDKTNFEDIYSRNKVRLDIIPYMEKNFNKDIIGTLCRMADLLSLDNEFMEAEGEKIFQKYCDIKGQKVIIYKETFRYHKAIVKRVIRKALQKLKGNLTNIDSTHIESIIGLQSGTTGKYISLPEGISAYNVYGNVELCAQGFKECSENKKVTEHSTINHNIVTYPLIPGDNVIKSMGIKVVVKQVNVDEYKKQPVSKYIKFFDGTGVDVEKDITIRYRKDGDKFSPLGMSGNKKIKDYFIDLKIPRDERDKIPFLCFNDNISWVVGYQISNKYKICNHTKKVIMVKVERQESHE